VLIEPINTSEYEDILRKKTFLSNTKLRFYFT
jgi:hypothetical protein